ncbi:hypothetical protein EJD97_007040 [Solanum chilense]|uniref:PORR domain-containing protein n=1 Tax=Solanum chilense TaxID=4083 RepID=A0A6N2BNK2_SOLCI|nr:hypothetical protein EJD97_007040 [Solanum chilense]
MGLFYPTLHVLESTRELLLTQPHSMIDISLLDMLAHHFGFKQYEAGKYILKFPRVLRYLNTKFREYYIPGLLVNHCFKLSKQN